MTGDLPVPTRLRHGLIHLLGGVPAPDPAARVTLAPGSTRAPEGPPEQPRAERVGLVLSGGGARSSFQLGALQYLYRREEFAAHVISGTSAGSILAAVIAQYADHDGQAAAVEDLRELWLGMEGSADLFTELEWFTKLREHMPTWRRVMALRHRPTTRTSLTANLSSVLQGPRKAVERLAARPEGEVADGAAPADAPTGGAGAPGSGEPAPSGVAAHGEAASPADGPNGAPRHAASAARNFGLLRAGHAEHSTPAEHGFGWVTGNVLETLSTLWEASRTSTDLDAIIRGATTERAAFRPGPLVDRIVEPQRFDPGRLAASGVELRVAVVALESGELRYVTQTGEFRDRADRPIAGAEPAPVIDAVRASCAIPSVFPPVRLGEEHYVDGGARESLPVEVTVGLGVSRCIAVVASPAGLPREGDFGERDMLEIVMRTGFGIMTDEIQRDEVRYAQSAGALVIQPELDIHDLLTVEPGLVSIAMDYGWLRAADVCEGAPAEVRTLTRDLINLRRLIWTTEDEMFNPEAPALAPRPTMSELVELKLRLRDLVERADPQRLPPGAADWWRNWERHAFEIEPEPGWV